MEDKYEVYGIANCPFCTKAIDLLKDNYLRHNYFHLDKMASTMSANIMSDANMTTVPIIYCNGELVGGYAELRESLDGE